jgi:hypothetical protein
MKSHNPRFFVITISLIVIIIITVPFLIAEMMSGEDFIFGGFLINPIDGNTYLAKMYQGWKGSWRYKLAFTAEPGSGAYINLFYLGLGQVSRVINLSLLYVFHLARVTGCLILLWALWYFFKIIFIRARTHKLAFALAALGSGMGWILLPAGGFTSDFWVAETYPFLSSYTNPHFTIGLSLILGLLYLNLQNSLRFDSWLYTAGGSLALSLINPFGVIIVLMVLGGCFVWNFVGRSAYQPPALRLAIVLIFGLPALIYDLWAAHTVPELNVWNSQNITLSPSIWDLVVSLSPALIFSIVGMIRFAKGKKHPKSEEIGTLVIWAVLGLLLIYLPMDLQRRFMMGLYIPLAGLASYGVEFIAGDQKKRYRLLVITLFLFALPTNFIILLTSHIGISTYDPSIYIHKDEFFLLEWIEENTGEDVLILSSPEMGLLIPAHSGRRVLYGHPFETVNASEEEAAVRAFFQGKWSHNRMRDFINSRDVDYIFYGLREKAYGDIQNFFNLPAVYASGEVSLYKFPNKSMP